MLKTDLIFTTYTMFEVSIKFLLFGASFVLCTGTVNREMLASYRVNSHVLWQSHNGSQSYHAAKHASDDLLSLEAEPVCHTVAARFLVNNCRVLEDKDDASMLTDSGRHIRDFLESYAVSLAICDLERGNKTIPSECIKFQESSLARLAVQDAPHLHVTSEDIQTCLSSFAHSAVVWGTYISHKQNALRFCEASMAENDRTRSIKLFQRVTQIMGTLVGFIDADWEQHLKQMMQSAHDTMAVYINSLADGLMNLQQGMQATNEYVLRTLQASLQGLATSTQDIEEQLHQLFYNLSREAKKNQQENQKEYRGAVELFNQEASAVISALATEAQASIGEMNREIESTRARMTELEQDIQRSAAMIESQSFRIGDNNEQLAVAKRATKVINHELKDAALTASEFGKGLSSRFYSSPVLSVGCFSIASLVLGSYGLPPSLVRNGGLIAFGASISVVMHAWSSGDIARPSFHHILALFEGDPVHLNDSLPHAPARRKRNTTSPTTHET